MKYLEKFIKYYNEDDQHKNLKELELKILIDQRKKEKLPKFINKISPEETIGISKYILKKLLRTTDRNEITQTINFISNKINNKSYIRQLHFNGGTQIKEKKQSYIKENLHNTPLYIRRNENELCVKISYHSETPIDEDIIDFNFIRYRFRISFTIGVWRADFTFVKTSCSKQLNEMKMIKNKLFASGIDVNNILDEDWFWNYADIIELEFEFVGGVDLTIEEIGNVLDFIKINKDYDILDDVHNMIYLKPKSHDKITLKKILPGAIEINKKQYFTEILPNIENFYVTDKADGVRTLLMINTNFVSYYDDKFHNISNERPEKNNTYEGEIVIECEKIDDHFYGYDIIKYNGQSVCHLPFNQRLNILNGVKCPNLTIKLFTRLTKENYKAELIDIYKKASEKSYHIDGLIFTSANNIYAETKFYKWKPITDMTIDFLVRKCPKELLGIYPYEIKEGQSIYLLFCGISMDNFKKMNLKRVQYYNKLFSHTSAQYFPIQFMPSDKPNAHIWYCEYHNLDNKIIELNYDTNDKKWVFNRIREDRVNDQKKHYYGNNYMVAELIWRNYSNPLKFEDLLKSSQEIQKDFYFINENSMVYHCIRKYNNMVKFELIKKFSVENSCVVDLGCGKGQDLFKYIKSKISTALFIDINENNLCEIISRKYTYCSDKAYAGYKTSVYIQKLDLNMNYLDNLEKIESSGIPLVKQKINLIICNFAIHYFIFDKKHMKNIVNMISTLLPVGGRFLFTCLNGQKVHELFGDNSTTWTAGDSKYIIEKKYTHKKFTGIEQFIRVLLPFSNGELYTESLVNLDLIKQHFEKKNIRLEYQGCFDSYIGLFQKKYPDLYSLLDDADKRYIKLLNFSVYYKSS